MPKANLETTQNVYLKLEIASIGERVVAAFIDRAVLFLYIWIASLFIDLTGWGNVLEDEKTGYYVSMFFFSLPVFLIAFLWDVISNGQSVGKKLMKMRVIKTDGSTPSIGDFLLRWMLRIIDLYLIAIMVALSASDDSVGGILIIFTTPVVGIVLMAMTGHNQRFGDLASNTIVVKKEKRVTLEDTVLPLLRKKYKPRFLNVLELNDRDVRIIKEVIDRSEPGENTGLVEKLSHKAKEILSITTDMPPRKFLYTLMKDYNYLAMEESKKMDF